MNWLALLAEADPGTNWGVVAGAITATFGGVGLIVRYFLAHLRRKDDQHARLTRSAVRVQRHTVRAIDRLADEVADNTRAIAALEERVQAPVPPAEEESSP